MEKLKEALLKEMDENTFKLNHEKMKTKELCKTIRQLIKLNEAIENKVDIMPYIKERDEHLKNVAIHKLEQRKLNRIYKIIFND